MENEIICTSTEAAVILNNRLVAVENDLECTDKNPSDRVVMMAALVLWEENVAYIKKKEKNAYKWPNGLAAFHSLRVGEEFLKVSRSVENNSLVDGSDQRKKAVQVDCNCASSILRIEDFSKLGVSEDVAKKLFSEYCSIVENSALDKLKITIEDNRNMTVEDFVKIVADIPVLSGVMMRVIAEEFCICKCDTVVCASDGINITSNTINKKEKKIGKFSFAGSIDSMRRSVIQIFDEKGDDFRLSNKDVRVLYPAATTFHVWDLLRHMVSEGVLIPYGELAKRVYGINRKKLNAKKC